MCALDVKSTATGKAAHIYLIDLEWATTLQFFSYKVREIKILHLFKTKENKTIY